MKKIKYLLSLLIFTAFAGVSNAETVAVQVTAAPSVQKNFSQTYKTSAENLLYLLLSGLNDLNYSIEEIQFKSGCVLFKAYSKEFIASVVSGDGYKAFLNIVPADNNYNFQPSLIEKLQRYIDSNNTINFQRIL